ncbi:MAG TPA: hypothetical protein VFQ12_02490 [Thermoleophilaceae bacterium]|nr:hypothetical protein [Thermoleophilaceae bacterium]
MKRFARVPSPAMIVACAALFVALGGVSYGFATGSISSREIRNRTIVNKDVRDRGLRGEKLRRDSVGPNAVKEESLNSLKLGAVTNAVAAQGLARHVVVAVNGSTVRGRGQTSTARTGAGQYQAVFDRDVRQCVYVATLGDESAAGPGTGQIAVTSLPSNVNGVRVVTRNSAGTAENRSFHLVVSC